LESHLTTEARENSKQCHVEGVQNGIYRDKFVPRFGKSSRYAFWRKLLELTTAIALLSRYYVFSE